MENIDHYNITMHFRKKRNASPNPFETDDDDINLHAPTPVQYGNE